jgi:hypothetical protein
VTIGHGGQLLNCEWNLPGASNNGPAGFTSGSSTISMVVESAAALALKVGETYAGSGLLVRGRHTVKHAPSPGDESAHTNAELCRRMP